MRVFVMVAVLGLGVSAYFAPRHFEARPGSIDESRLIDTDGGAMIALGEGPEKALGTGLAGATMLNDGARRFRFALMIWAAAPGQADLPGMVRGEVKRYLKNRETVDPDGSVLLSVLVRWLEVRLGNKDFMMQLAPAVWLASRGDKRGIEKLWHFVEAGPFEQCVLPYIRRSDHPQWSSVRPIIEHYLEHGDLQARVLAGAGLLDYNSLWGFGARSLQEHRDEIFKDLREARVVHKRRIDFLAEPHAVLSSLAMLGGEGIEILKAMPEIKLDENVDLLRVARMWVGIDRFSKIPIGSLKWRLLDPDTQAFYFQAATHRFLRLARAGKTGEELEEVRKIVEAGVESTDTTAAWTCITGLMAFGEPYRTDLPKRCARMGGSFAILMASTVPTEGILPLLLHGVVSDDPLIAGLSATLLAISEGPLPMQGPVD